MSLRAQLTDIYKAQGELTPKLVVDLARSADHPLHSRFEWDNGIAGEKYREIQAADLIRSVRIKYSDNEGEEERDVRAFHVIPREDSSSYVPIEEVAQDDFSRKILLQAAEREWKSLRRKYAHLDEFMSIIKADLAAGAA